MLKCCAAMPSDRPSFSTLHNVFRSLHTTTSNTAEYITLNIDSASPYYLTSPRSSTTESQIEVNDCALLVDSPSPKPTEIGHSSHTTHYHSHPPKVPVEHSRSASYTCSDSGFLPCIEEEKEEEEEEEEEEDSDTQEEQEKGNENRDSGNVSTSSHESLKENNGYARENTSYNRENSDEAVEMDESNMDGMELIWLWPLSR